MNFFQKVYELVADIPKGQVATYGQIASLVSSPRAARLVGFALRQLEAESKIPWQRVVNSQGMISIENLNFPKEEQVRRLQKEGVAVEFRDGNYWVDLGEFLWDPKNKCHCDPSVRLRRADGEAIPRYNHEIAVARIRASQ